MIKRAKVYAEDLYDLHITHKGYNQFVKSATSVFKEAINDARAEILEKLSPELAADIRAELEKP